MFHRFVSSIRDNHFAKFAVATVACSSLVGWAALQLLLPLPNTNNTTHGKESMTHDEAMVRAMIQNAQSSTWQENLENAAMAQERFVLPGRGHSATQEEFLQDIKQKSHAMMRENEAKKKEREEQVEIFSTTWKKD